MMGLPGGLPRGLVRYEKLRNHTETGPTILFLGPGLLGVVAAGRKLARA